MARLSEAVGASVHVKATTGERMGFVGREEGVAAMAVATLERAGGRRWTWSAETVEGLAPDAASVTAARKLARPGPWSATGFDERAVWGLCKGSGSRPYQTQVDLSGPGVQVLVPVAEVPVQARAGAAAAVGGWRRGGGSAAGVGARSGWTRAGSAASRAASRPAPGEPPRDPEAAARRAAEREARVAAGVEDLQRWLRDAVRGGLGAGRLRLVGRVGRVRGAARRRPGAGRGVAAAVAGRRRRGAAGRLAGAAAERPRAAAPAVRGATRGPTAPLRDDVRALLGCNVGREEVLSGPRVSRTAGSCWRGSSSSRSACGCSARGCGGSRPAARRCCWTSRRRARRWSRGRRRGWRSTPRSRSTRARRRCARCSPARRRGRAGAGVVRRAAASARRCASVASAVAANPWLDEWPVVLRAAVPDGRDGGAWSATTPDGALPLGGSDRRPLAPARGLRRAPGLALRALGRLGR